MPCAHRGSHDVEVRVVDRIDLLAGGSDDTERLRVDHLVTAVGRLADLAHADASVHAGDAHSGRRHDRILGAVLGQGGSGGVDSGQGHISPPSVFLDFTGNTGLHVTHHVVELRFVDTGWRQVRAASADGLLGLGVGAPKLTCGHTYMHPPQSRQTAEAPRRAYRYCVAVPVR